MFSFRSRSRSRASKEVDNNGISSGAKKKSTTTTKATPMKPIRSTTTTTATTTALSNTKGDDRMNYSTPETLISPLSSIDDPNKIKNENSSTSCVGGGGGRVLFDMAPSSPGPVSTSHHRNNASKTYNSRRLSHKSTDLDGSSTNSSQAGSETTSTDDDIPFMSAFTRSPPSFDKFDDDDIVGSNIFPVHNGNNNEWGGIGKRGPWDNTDEFDEDGDDSADPPAILTEWVSSSSSGNEEECEGNDNGVVVDNDDAQQSTSMWPKETRSKKSRMSLPSTSSSTNVRQVSPSSSSANVDTAWCNFGAFGDDFFGSGVDFTSGFVDVSTERENGGFPVNVVDDDDDTNFFDNSWFDGDKFGGGSKDQLWTTVTRTQTESSVSSYAQNNGSLSLAYTTSLEEQSITSNALTAGDLQPQSQLRNQQQQQQQQQQSHHQLKIPRPPPMEERKPSTGSSVRNKISLSSSNSVGSSRKGGGGGGSVGSNKSNSSAVDQILEHYRRRREQSSGGSVHSGSQMTGISHGSGSAVPSTGTTSMTGSTSPSSSSPLVVVTPGTTVKNRVAAIRVDNLADDGLRSSGPIAPLNSNQDTSIDRSTTIASSSTKSISRSKAPPPRTRRLVDVTTDDVMNDNEFLTSILEATIGPRGIAPDLESLSGRSFTGRPARRRDNHRRNGGSSGDSIGSRNSRLTMASHKSFRTYESTKSALTHMSSETRSVANDLFRLEAQLAEQIARQQGDVTRDGSERSLAPPKNVTYTTLLGAQPAPRPTSLFSVTAPPGKLGILLSNAKVGKLGTYVSAIRSTSVLAGKVHIGDIFESIDGEDVTLMTSKEIMNIMASRAEFERELQLRPAPMETN
jgi:hypothetical protein